MGFAKGFVGRPLRFTAEPSAGFDAGLLSEAFRDSVASTDVAHAVVNAKVTGVLVTGKEAPPGFNTGEGLESACR